MPSLARLTQPLAPLDAPLNALTDVTVRLTPWMWWPAGPPRRDRPLSGEQHAAYLAWTVALNVALELAIPERLQPSRRRLRLERAGTAVATLLLQALGAGAWNRRARRLRRRPWGRLLG